MSPSTSHLSYGFEITATSNGSLDYIFYINPPKIRVISFKGGGARVFVYQRFLEVVAENGVLEGVEEVGGSSSGCYAAIFAAVHYDDAKKRSKTLENVASAHLFDMMGSTPAWNLFKVLSYPLHFISQPLGLLSKGLGWIAKQFNKTLLGKIIGYPLSFVSTALDAVSTILSPRGIAGIINLMTKGGVYRGKKSHECMRDHLQRDTQQGLNAILRRLKHPEPYIQRLIDTGLCVVENNKLKVVPDITFKHFDELSKLPGSQFKKCYTTAMRLSDKSLVVFNKENTPHMPIHIAARLAITFPLFFQVKSYQGEKYIDGGVFNNAPVDLAEPRRVSAFKQSYGVTDNLSRLNVRVEYANEHEHHLWKKPPLLNRIETFFSSIKRAIFKVITRGIDSIAADDQVTKTMRDDFAQRTIQLKDFDIDRMQVNVKKGTRDECLDHAEETTRAYFNHHHDEKVVIEHYHAFGDSHVNMPVDVRRKLLKFLQNKENKTEEIFRIPGKSQAELESLRESEIQKLHAGSTSLLLANMDRASEFRNQAASHQIEQGDRDHQPPQRGVPVVTERTPLLNRGFRASF